MSQIKYDPIKAAVLSIRVIPNAAPELLKVLKAPKGYRSLGILTSDCDDVSYAALDEATKKAQVQVAYAKSMYAGSSNASTRLAGEFLGVLAGPDPEEVRSGLEAAKHFIENDSCFYSADDDNKIVFFAHCVSRTGTYLSAQANVEPGGAMAYLIAPPLEALYALDAAIKAADVTLKVFYGPPTETNFAGGLLTGDHAACKAACEAFADRVCMVAGAPLKY